MKAIFDFMINAANWIWGWPMLIFLGLSGIYLAYQIKGIQFRRFKHVMKNTIGASGKKNEKDGISGFQAVSAALAATLGTGNVVGIGLAIGFGGPGAIFWMWLVGLLAMGIKYSEVTASLIYRERRPDGEYSAGPYNYIKNGIKNKSVSKILSSVYVIVLIVVLLIAASVHTGAITDAMEQINVSRKVVSIVAIAVVVFVVYGGVTRIVKITEKLVPIMAIVYMVACLFMIIAHIDNLFPAIGSIFKYAFTPHAAVGGFGGSVLALTLRWGISRGMYSNDSGNGIQSIVHGQASVEHPVQQGLWGIFEVFFDTIVVCTFTALAILSSGVWTQYGVDNASVLTQLAFKDTFGNIGNIVITIVVVLFAFSTVLSFAFFIENQTTSLFNKKIGRIMQVVFFIFMGIGGIYGVTKAMQIGDFANAFIILLNMVVILKLGKVIGEYTKDYFEKVDRGEIWNQLLGLLQII